MPVLNVSLFHNLYELRTQEYQGGYLMTTVERSRRAVEKEIE